MLSQSLLKSYLKYDEDTGVFTWILSPSNRVKVGDKAGNMYSNGYIYIGLLGKQYRAHRLAWFYVKGVWPKDQLDHKNRIRHDNRICNLRESTHRKNGRNRSDNYNSQVGAGWDKYSNKYVSKIRVNTKLIHLGYFDNLEDAVKARKEAEIKYNFYGEDK